MMNIFKYGITLAAMTVAVTAMAGEDNTFRIGKDKVFVTAGAQTEAFMNNEGHILGTVKLGTGVWIRPWLGLKLEGVAGNTRLKTKSRGQVFGAQLSYMANILGGKDRIGTFGLNAVVAGGFMHHRFGTILEKYTYMNMLTANVGLQGVYYFTPNWNIYLEPTLILQPKYYDTDNKNKTMPGLMLTAGINYSFGKRLSKEEKKTRISYGELERMNEEINEMKQKLAEAEQKENSMKDKEVIVMPKEEYHTIAVKFDVMGAVMDENETGKLKDVATWIKDHGLAVTVIPFAECDNTDGTADEVKQKRFDAIFNVLTGKFGVDRSKVLKGDAEKMGYDKHDNEAFIMFMEK